ncbi:hypothetical protein [Arthrobacter sp. KK5.5]|uniref:hypothetical protein n=1 Tax=Arthrobacter sp. KK5.5 TaxID=3373084 RepID=UPI003EE5A7A1
MLPHPRHTAAEPPVWVQQAADGMRAAGAIVGVRHLHDHSAPTAGSPALNEAELVIATSPRIAAELSQSGVPRARLWTFVQERPQQPLRLSDDLQGPLAEAIAMSRKVVVFDEDARSTVERAFWEATANVLVFPALAGTDAPVLPGAASDSVPALVINLDVTGAMGLQAIRHYSRHAQRTRSPRPVFLVCDSQLSAGLRQHTVLKEFAAIPGARVVAPDEASLTAALASVRPLGFLPAPEPTAAVRSNQALRWFAARGIELFAERGSVAADPHNGVAAFWEPRTIAEDLASVASAPSRVPRREDTAVLAEFFSPLFADYAQVPSNPRRTRVLLVGADFKFAGDYVEALAQRQDIDLRVDMWDNNSTPQPELSAPLMEWAEVVICEFSSVNALWYSQNLPAGKRLHVHLHGFELRSSWIRDLNIDAVEKVVFVSEFYRQKALDRMGWPDHKTTVIPNSVQSADLSRPKLRGSRFHLGMAGIVPALKRPDRALDLLELLLEADPRYTLHLRGHKPWNYTWEWKKPLNRDAYLAFFERLRQNDTLREAVVFDPFGPDMGNWFRRIGWTLSPSTRETFHLAPVEGMASGAVPVVWRREGADEIFSEAWSFDDTRAAADFILAANAEPGRYDEFGRAAAELAARYDARLVRAQWLNLVFGSSSGTTPNEQDDAGGPTLTGSQQEHWSMVAQLEASGRYAQAQSLLEQQPSLPWLLPDAQRRLAGRVSGVPALRQRAHRLHVASPQPALRDGNGADLVVVQGRPGNPLPTRAAGPSGMNVLRLGEPVDDVNAAFDVRVDAVVARALEIDARNLSTSGDELAALACTVAGGRLGLPVFWDVAGSPGTSERIERAMANPSGATPRESLSLMAARHCAGVSGAPNLHTGTITPVEDMVGPASMTRLPTLGLVCAARTDMPSDPVFRAVALDPLRWHEQLEGGVDAVVVCADAATGGPWQRSFDIEPDDPQPVHRLIDVARRLNLPVGFLHTDPDQPFEEMLGYARRADAVMVPRPADLERLHDHRLLATQVSAAVPRGTTPGPERGRRLLDDAELLQLLWRMLRVC